MCTAQHSAASHLSIKEKVLAAELCWVSGTQLYLLPGTMFYTTAQLRLSSKDVLHMHRQDQGLALPFKAPQDALKRQSCRGTSASLFLQAMLP